MEWLEAGVFEMPTTAETRVNGAVIRYETDILKTIEPNLFNVDWLRSNGFWQGSTRGRSQAHFLHYADHDMVLRHFNRGGLIGRVNRDLYLGVNAAKSRALSEFDLLATLRAQGLAVPRPVAARYVPVGPFYRADIITQRIPTAQTLAEILRDTGLSSNLWTAIGAAVGTLHNHHVFHSDLNCRNIMIDSDDMVWLIDFDKCWKRESGSWMQDNLDRLERSLKKAATEFAELNWCRKDWDDLLSGYVSQTNSRA